MQSEQTPWFARVRDEAKSLLAPVNKFLAREDVKAAWQWLKEPLLSVAVVFALTTIIAQPFYVPSGSMEPTLAIGDAVFAAKFPYGYSCYSIPFVNCTTPKSRFLGRLPAVGDVVVFRLPSNTSITYVKRLVGLPGDHIQVKNGHLWINGKQLPLRPAGVGQDELEGGRYIEVPKYIETLPNGKEHEIFQWQWDGPWDNTPVYVVPPGHVFMMGDNRNYSSDSRVPPDQGGVGYVPIGDLVGRPFIVIGSVDFMNADNLLEWPLEFRFSRIFHLIH